MKRLFKIGLLALCLNTALPAHAGFWNAVSTGFSALCTACVNMVSNVKVNLKVAVPVALTALLGSACAYGYHRKRKQAAERKRRKAYENQLKGHIKVLKNCSLGEKYVPVTFGEKIKNIKQELGEKIENVLQQQLAEQKRERGVLEYERARGVACKDLVANVLKEEEVEKLALVVLECKKSEISIIKEPKLDPFWDDDAGSVGSEDEDSVYFSCESDCGSDDESGSLPKKPTVEAFQFPFDYQLG